MITNLVLLAVVVTTPHLFAGETSTGVSTQEVVTISIPDTPPIGVAESAWVMAEAPGPCGYTTGNYTQVGWSWQPGLGSVLGGPRIFAYTSTCEGGGVWWFGPAVSPGGVVTVDISSVGDTLTDEYLSPTYPPVWQAAMSATFTGPVTWQTQVESYGPMTPVCFSGQMVYDQGWSNLPDGCWG